MSAVARKAARLGVLRNFSSSLRCLRYNSTQAEASTFRWDPAHKPGEYPLYDMALEVIREDSQRIYARMDALKKDKQVPSGELKATLEELEVLAEMNRPEIRWALKNGKADMSKPVYRYLAQRSWREEGKLDHLMQRIHTMNIVPDLFGDFHPDLDVSISFGCNNVEAGTFVEPEMTLRPPSVSAQPFHAEERYYTLIMVDPDVPDVASQSYQTYLHWLIPNIPISSISPKPLPLGQIEEEIRDSVTPYIPPHPQNGTPYHRYTLLLLPHPNPYEKLPITSLSSPDSRLGFNLRDFTALWGFKPEGGGGHFWRAVWSPAVSQIYEETLNLPEPRYGRPPKVDKYEEMKRIRRYI